MNRRDFLKSQLCVPALSLLPHFVPLVSFSQEQEPQFFIQFYVDGGWDTTLATEAWSFQAKPDPEQIFIEYSENETLSFGKKFVGPALAPLKPFFNRMTIFNGVMMSPVEVGHPSPENLAKSGASDGSLGNFVTQFYDLYYANSRASLITNSSINSANKYYRSSNHNSIKNLLSYAGNISQETNLGNSGLIANAQKQLNEVIKQLNSVEKDYGMYLSKLTSEEHKTLVTGFLSQLYPIAFFSCPNSMDTHSDHPTKHKNDLIKNFDFIAGYLDALSTIPYGKSGKSLLDLTHVVITSEFTRTPRLNLSKGKDHNPYSNSMIVISRNLKSEEIFGASRLVDSKFSPIGVPILVGAPLHKDTLQVHYKESDSIMMTPTTVYSSLVDSLGKIDQASLLFKNSPKLKATYNL